MAASADAVKAFAVGARLVLTAYEASFSKRTDGSVHQHRSIPNSVEAGIILIGTFKLRTLASIIVALAAASCAAPLEPPQRADALPQARQAPSLGILRPTVEVAFYRSNGIIFSSRLVGTLAIIDNCIMATGPSYPDGILLFFPEGMAHWNEEDRSMTIGSERFRLGDQISLTGGNSSVSNFGERANLPRSCARSGGFFAGAKAMIVP